MKKNIIIIGVIVLAAAVVWFLFFRKSSNSDYELETITMQPRDIDIMVTATGAIEPITKVDVGTQVSGIISKIYVDYNSEVKKGQVLAELDKVALQSDLASKEIELKSSKVEYEFQKKNFERISDLYKKELVSQTDYESAQYTFAKAQSSYDKLQSDLVKVRTNLGYATITSPIDGVVLSRAVEEGQTVASSFNTPTLFTIANDLTKMEVVANVDEADIGDVRTGQRVSFNVAAYPSDIFQGTVSQVRLEPIVTSNVVTYEVLINAPNPDMKLKPGLTANITIYTQERTAVNSLPNKVFSYIPDMEMLKKAGFSVQEDNEPVKRDPDQKRIWVLNGNTVEPQIITVGITDGINTEIISGLTENDKTIEGIATVVKKIENTPEKSPFMPQRRGGRAR
jgi:HlyD family secretion protein